MERHFESIGKVVVEPEGVGKEEELEENTAEGAATWSNGGNLGQEQHPGRRWK